MVDAKNWPRRTRLEKAGGRGTHRQAVYNIIHRLHESKVSILELEAQRESIGKDELKEILVELKSKGLVYSPKPGKVVCVD